MKNNSLVQPFLSEQQSNTTNRKRNDGHHKNVILTGTTPVDVSSTNCNGIGIKLAEHTGVDKELTRSESYREINRLAKQFSPNLQRQLLWSDTERIEQSTKNVSVENFDLQKILERYNNYPSLLELILLTKLEEDRRRAEEAKLKQRELDYYIRSEQKQLPSRRNILFEGFIPSKQKYSETTTDSSSISHNNDNSERLLNSKNNSNYYINDIEKEKDKYFDFSNSTPKPNRSPVVDINEQLQESENRDYHLRNSTKRKKEEHLSTSYSNKSEDYYSSPGSREITQSSVTLPFSPTPSSSSEIVQQEDYQGPNRQLQSLEFLNSRRSSSFSSASYQRPATTFDNDILRKDNNSDINTNRLPPIDGSTKFKGREQPVLEPTDPSLVSQSSTTLASTPFSTINKNNSPGTSTRSCNQYSSGSNIFHVLGSFEASIMESLPFDTISEVSRSAYLEESGKMPSTKKGENMKRNSNNLTNDTKLTDDKVISSTSIQSSFNKDRGDSPPRKILLPPNQSYQNMESRLRKPTRKRRREMQSITMIIETKEFPYNDEYVWKNNGNTVHKNTGQKSIYYKCSNSNTGCPVNKTVTFRKDGEYLIKYRGDHLKDCNKIKRITNV